MLRPAMRPVRALLLAALLLAGAPALAWDNQGHMLTGVVAYDRLAAVDPAAVAEIEALMARHPDRARFEQALAGTTGVERSRKMFALMARWPDDIRKTRWDHPVWHYALKVVYGWTWLGWFTAGNAFDAYADNLAVARDPKAAPADRAVALCWVFHIAGDMHEPLHRGHRMDLGWPTTDRAGTIAFVRRVTGGPVIDLHDAWDTAASLAGDDSAAVAVLTPKLLEVARRLPADAAPQTFEAWSAESEGLARNVAYAGTALGASAARASAPVLDAPYQVRARAISERRIAQAGVRLAGVLKGLKR